jgi:energy-converting hydrogenase A subunit M
MIKLQMHETTLDGKPLPDTGRIISGEDAYEVIEAMKLQSPFTADMTEREYIDNILSKIMACEETTELDATEFLTKLAERGFLSFLPEDDLHPARLMDVIKAIRQSGATNMLDAGRVAEIAELMDEEDVADWIKNNRREYAKIILHGRRNPETEEAKPCADNAGGEPPQPNAASNSADASEAVEGE